MYFLSISQGQTSIIIFPHTNFGNNVFQKLLMIENFSLYGM